MKRIFTAIASLALLATAANAAQWTWGNFSVTNNVPNNSTTTANLGSEVGVSDYKEIGVQIQFELDGSGTTACTFGFLLSNDGTNYNAGATAANCYDWKAAIVPNGTTTVRTNATITLGAARKIKVAGITAANNSAAMTNIIVSYDLKPSQREYTR